MHSAGWRKNVGDKQPELLVRSTSSVCYGSLRNGLGSGSHNLRGLHGPRVSRRDQNCLGRKGRGFRREPNVPLSLPTAAEERVICRRVSSLHARRACLRFAAPGWVAPVLAPGRPLDSQQLEGGRRGGGSVRLARSARRPWLSRNEKTLPAFPGNRPSLPSDHCGGTGDAHQLVRGARVWDRAYSPESCRPNQTCLCRATGGPSTRKRPF
jgi:hypothetical protein